VRACIYVCVCVCVFLQEFLYNPLTGLVLLKVHQKTESELRAMGNGFSADHQLYDNKEVLTEKMPNNMILRVSWQYY
jgi:hypothetical protein